MSIFKVTFDNYHFIPRQVVTPVTIYFTNEPSDSVSEIYQLIEKKYASHLSLLTNMGFSYQDAADISVRFDGVRANIRIAPFTGFPVNLILKYNSIARYNTATTR